MKKNLSADEILSTLPTVLAESREINAIGYAIARQIEKRRAKLTYVNLYAHIHDLDEKTLDAIAESFALGWYNYGYTLEQKRALLKQAGAIKRREGTHWAVLTVLKILYGDDVEVKYWYEDTMGLLVKNQFKVLCLPGHEDDIDLEEARRAIERVKRVTAKFTHIAPTAVYNGEYCFDGTLKFNNEV